MPPSDAFQRGYAACARRLQSEIERAKDLEECHKRAVLAEEQAQRVIYLLRTEGRTER